MYFIFIVLRQIPIYVSKICQKVLMERGNIKHLIGVEVVEVEEVEEEEEEKYTNYRD